jgi:hypothetical protein
MTVQNAQSVQSEKSSGSKKAVLRAIFEKVARPDRRGHKDAGALARAWWYNSAEKLGEEGAQISDRIRRVRGMIWNVIVGAYVQCDKGNDKGAWETMYIASWCFNPPINPGAQGNLNLMARAELEFRKEQKDSAAALLLDIAYLTDHPLMLVRWSESMKIPRVESYGEMFARHLRAICLHDNEVVRSTYRKTREQIVAAGHLPKEVAQNITDKANGERAAIDKKIRDDAKAAIAAAKKAEEERMAARKVDDEARKAARKVEAKADKPKPKTQADLVAEANKKLGR